MSKKPEEFYKLVASGFKAMAGAEVYSCRFEKRAGWAIIMLHEDTGAVAIHSDYGDWTFLWPQPGRGPGTLKEFICHGSYEYMACKFMGKRDRQEFDAEATLKQIKLRLLYLREEGILTKERAREIYDDLEVHDTGTSEETFWHTMPVGIREVCEDFSDYSIHRNSHEYMWLAHGILPALVAELRKTLPNRCTVCLTAERASGSDACDPCIKEGEKLFK